MSRSLEHGERNLSAWYACNLTGMFAHMMPAVRQLETKNIGQKASDHSMFTTVKPVWSAAMTRKDVVLTQLRRGVVH